MIITVLAVEIDLAAGWAVGACTADLGEVDRDLLTDPAGAPWIPASSLAGSLRAHLAGHEQDETLMGSRPPEGRREEPLEPSKLWLVGTTLHVKDGERAPATDVVATTAIDPTRRAARPTSLRNSRVVTQPTAVTLYLQYEGVADELLLLARWRPQIGRDRTRGGGQAQLQRITYRTYDLSREGDLYAWLSTPGTDRFSALPNELPMARNLHRPPVLSLTFEIADALHIGTGTRRDKTAEVLTRDGAPIIPASTWKGLFRARAAYILRTVHGPEAACQTQTGCGDCTICELFGSTSRRGRLAFTDSTITTGKRNPATPVARTHVAIDRITAGARDKLLFTQNVIETGKLTLTIHPLSDITEPHRNLLLHVVRDLDDRLIGVGGGAQRGQGTLTLTAGSRKTLTGLPPIPARQEVP